MKNLHLLTIKDFMTLITVLISSFGMVFAVSYSVYKDELRRQEQKTYSEAKAVKEALYNGNKLINNLK